MQFGSREVIFLIVLLVVPVASYFYVFKPRNNEIRQAQIEVENKQAKLDNLREVTEKIDDIGLAIDKGRAAIQLVEAKLPSARDVEVILEDVWELAASSRLSVKSIKSEKPVPAALYMEQPLRMVVTGRFDGFYQFLLEMENLSRITRVPRMKLERLDSLSGSPDDLELDSGLMTAEFTLSIYFEPPASERTANGE